MLQEVGLAIYVSQEVREKLENKHGGIGLHEIEQCFANRSHGARFLKDTRERHKTDPPTL